MMIKRTSPTRTETRVTRSPICQSVIMHSTMAPAAMKGARTTSRRIMATALCIWLTSLTTRVTSEAEENLSISR